MPMYATVGGVQRELSAVPVTVAGVQREQDQMLATIGGVAREIFSSASTWEKYTVVKTLQTTGSLTYSSLSSVESTTVKKLSSNDPESATTSITMGELAAGDYYIRAGTYYYVNSVKSGNIYHYKCNVVSSKGEYLGSVTASAGTYPDNGVQDGYWYVKI